MSIKDYSLFCPKVITFFWYINLLFSSFYFIFINFVGFSNSNIGLIKLN
jgi:hypothetical protein